jgi:hypothetical protein
VTRRANRIRFTGTYSGRDEAAATLTIPGDAALVCRGVPRMLLLNCPCGCGDILVVNLDKRAGPAWRMYQRGKSLSVFPSYWRDSKCESHFILWRNNIYWCDWEDDSLWTSASSIEERVLRELPDHFTHYEALAEQLQEVPWDVLLACNSLVRKGKALMNMPRSTGEFRRRASSY